jgi:glutathione S-transferase
MPSRKLKLYAHPESGHSYKVKLMLCLAGIEHDYEVVDILIDRDRRPEPFKSLSLPRFGEVPLLVSDDEVFVQSNAILLYLANKLSVFGGLDPALMARAQEWLFWEANKLGLSLPHLRLARNYFPDDFSPGAVEWLQARYEADSSRLEQELEDGRAFVLGHMLTVADLSLCSYLFWANQASVRVKPRTAAWLARIAALPGWKSPYRLLDPSGSYETFGIVKDEFIPPPVAELSVGAQR